MYKCKECGTEFETKPDYCDCGNDTFDEILPQEQQLDDKNSPSTDKNDMWVEENGFGYPINEESYNKMKNKSNALQEPQVTTVKNNTPKIKPYAIIIFVLCLILSVLVILFAWNPKQSDKIQNSDSVTETEQKQIPDLEKIWNNKLPEVSARQENKPKEHKETVQRKTTPEVKSISQSKPQTTKVTLNKKPQTSKTSAKQTQPVTKNTSQTKPQTVTKTVKQTVNANPQEIANYKIKLRNHIASKISFASVVGDGTCTFSFSVASNGELTNKKPVSLSDNESLNEAVYNALRQVYSYSTPPTGYKSETLKLTVKMYSNNFEVSLN